MFSRSDPSFPNSWRETFKFPEPVNDNGKITLVSMEAKLVFPVVCKALVEAEFGKAEELTTTAPVLHATTFVSKLVVSDLITPKSVIIVSCFASVANDVSSIFKSTASVPSAETLSDCHLVPSLPKIPTLCRVSCLVVGANFCMSTVVPVTAVLFAIF